MVDNADTVPVVCNKIAKSFCCARVVVTLTGSAGGGAGTAPAAGGEPVCGVGAVTAAGGVAGDAVGDVAGGVAC